ncbi:MAG: GNAT family N-acetyltransferase, partial [Gaiellaceae bacterium]
MTEPLQTTVRRLGPGDEDIVRRLAEGRPQSALLADDRTIFLGAFDGDDPIGFVFGYDLPRRHGAPSMVFVYEIDVDPAYRRRGIAKRLLVELLRLGRGRGAVDGFVLTEPDNVAANALYESVGGVRSDVVMWDFPEPATEQRASYRAATVGDVGLLAAWHADPDVARYWDDERPPAEEIRADLADPTVDQWIVLDGEEPVGFLQSWRAEGEPLRGGLDGFLIPSARGRGLMPRAARELAQSLLDAGWSEVTVDPYEWN